MAKGTRLLLALSCVGAAACANILGIDDGIPLSSVDASLDVGADVTIDAQDGNTADVPPEGAFSPLGCGLNNVCNFALGETCCRTGAATFTCLDAGVKCVGTDIPCDRPSQCAGGDAGPRKCCTTDVLTDAGTYVASSVACMLAAQCSPIPTHYILCGDDSGADCPDGTTCAPSANTLPPFLLCK